MVTNKTIKEFAEQNPEVPNYILEQVEEYLPKKTSQADIKKVLENIKKEYFDSQISPYEAIGVITAQSVGEPSTQMTLNTFHFAGVAAQSVEGLPRLIEILDAKKNLEKPIMKVYLKEEYLTEDNLKLVADKIRETKLADFTSNVDIDTEEKQVTIDLNTAELKRFEIEQDAIVSYLDKKIRKSSELTQNGKLVVSGTSSSSLKDLMNLKELALNSVVYGIKGIKDVTLVKEEQEYVIITQGISLSQVGAIEEVDERRLYCNDIHQMFANFGIEAARSTIMTEIMDVVTSQGLSIDERHVLLIADMMTYTGEPRGMTRYGIVADKLNVLTRASFETPLKHISKGAIMHERNELNTVTENVMMNQMAYVGTGKPKIGLKKKE